MVDRRSPGSGVLYQGDNLALMGALPGESVDLCYVDPPFGTGRRRSGEALGAAPGGRARAVPGGEAFVWDDSLGKNASDYMAWLGPRLEEMVRLLKPAGALLVHLDWRMAHYVKVLLDGLVGRERFVNEIVWHYASGGCHPKKRLARKHDIILWYARGRTYTCNLDAVSAPRNLCRLCGGEIGRKNHMKRGRDEKGRVVRMIRSNGRIYRYRDDDPVPAGDVWLDISHLQQRDPERTGYPTQKPLALLERLVLLCSGPGDLVADFFMGTGTALVAAARHGRRWLGCDAEPAAVDLAAKRLAAVVPPPAVRAVEEGP